MKKTRNQLLQDLGVIQMKLDALNHGIQTTGYIYPTEIDYCWELMLEKEVIKEQLRELGD